MIMKLYSVRDRLTGFGPLFSADNNDVAIRVFVMSFKNQQLSVPLEDLDLYLIGTYDTELGTLDSAASPVFVARGASLMEDVKDDAV